MAELLGDLDTVIELCCELGFETKRNPDSISVMFDGKYLGYVKESGDTCFMFPRNQHQKKYSSLCNNLRALGYGIGDANCG